MPQSITTPVDQGRLFFYSEPEALFRVGPIEASSEHADGEMLVGSWMRDRTGRASRGSLFVLVDDVFGVAALVHRPAGRWAVTTELSLDFGTDAPLEARAVIASADLVTEDAESGLGRGSVTDADGRLLAIGTARVRYSDQLPAQIGDPKRMILPHFERESAGPDGPVEDLLGAIITEDGLELPPSRFLANSMGPMHGGVLACASEFLAVTTARRTSEDFVTTSIHVAFVRPAGATESVTFTAVARHASRTLQVYEVTSRNAEGKACTIATVTCQVAS